MTALAVTSSVQTPRHTNIRSLPCKMIKASALPLRAGGRQPRLIAARSEAYSSVQGDAERRQGGHGRSARESLCVGETAAGDRDDESRREVQVGEAVHRN
jgi:hypothetical protein